MRNRRISIPNYITACHGDKKSENPPSTTGLDQLRHEIPRYDTVVRWIGPQANLQPESTGEPAASIRQINLAQTMSAQPATESLLYCAAVFWTKAMIPLHDDNPTDIRPIVTVTFIAISVVMFLFQINAGDAGNQRLILALGVVPVTLLGDARLAEHIALVAPTTTIFTSMFLHGGWMHLIGNMLYLWIFGNNVEDAMGHVRFVIFYLLCGVVAVFAQALPNPASEIPMIGASGAISGILGAYLLLHPRAKVLVLIPLGIILQPMRLPAGWVLGFWFVWQLISSFFADPGKGGVAFGAHIGGFVAGMALIALFKYRRVPLHLPFDRRP